MNRLFTGTVYQIRNQITDMEYIGSTLDYFRRIRAHSRRLVRNVHENAKLQGDYNEYGSDTFTVAPIASYTTRSEKWCEYVIRNLENQYMKKSKKSYNQIYPSSSLRGELNQEIKIEPITDKAYEGSEENKFKLDEVSQFGKAPLLKDYLTSKEILTGLKKRRVGVSTIEIPDEYKMKGRTAIRSAEIKVIRKMIADKKKDSEIAKAIGASLHSTMYIIKQIKACKKLKWEK